MKAEDAVKACCLCEPEGWGFDVRDFWRILDLWPNGSFVCESGGRIIGMVTTAAYKTSGWVGSVFVDPRFRSSGLGSALVSRAVRHLEELGLNSILLYSYKGMEGFYTKFGFRELDSYVSYRGPIRSHKGGMRADRMRRKDLGEVCELDAQCFGDDRSRLLKRVYQEFPETSLVIRVEGKLEGFVMATISEVLCNVGPGVALGEQWACLLLESLGSLLEGKECFLVTPSERGCSVVEELGLASGFAVTRMVRGREPEGMLERVFAIGALEKG